jgi:class 3 adenylate cyclase/tetratricopeptide (TPR) repeat protein
MTFEEILDQAIAMLQRRGRLTYGTLKRQFQLDDAALEDLKNELIEGQRLAVDERGNVLVWTGDPHTALPAAAPAGTPAQTPLAYTPKHLAEQILTSRSALEGERKQVTVLFADLKGSMELLADRDPEEARQLLDPVLERMMAAVHRYEGTVNQVLGDGIMALFGAPIAHEDHAVRACYAALAMQEAIRRYSEEARRVHGIAVQIRVGLNSGEVVVRAIGNDLHMDYSAIGQTTHLAARMEQLATPGSILLTIETLQLAEGFIQVKALGPVPVKGLAEPVEVCELLGATAIRRRLQAAVARGLTRFVGREPELSALQHVLARAAEGHGQVVAVLGEAGVGKSRLVYEFLHSHHTQGWRVLASASVSYGKAVPYFPVIDLLKRYAHVEEHDDPRTMRAKVTGQVLTLDETLQDTVPALLSLLDVLPADSPFGQLDPPQRRQRTLEALKRVLLRESQVQPLLLIVEDLHWIDSETQALLDSLVESLPTARLLLLVNYRPEYQHGWGSKTYYTQLRLDPLLRESSLALLQVLLGDDVSVAPLRPLLIERTEGNPFFLEESVRTLAETQVLAGERGAYRLAQALSSIQVPATVQAVLSARIDRLPPEEKRLLQSAAVIGHEVPLLLLQAIAECPEEGLYRGLAHLQASEFLYETRLFPEGEYTFKHALTHEVAYGSLLQERRCVLHARLVEALEALSPDRRAEQAEHLAHHALRGEVWEKAVRYCRQAGAKAMARSAYQEAAGYFEQALGVLEQMPESRPTREQAIDLHCDLRMAYVPLLDMARVLEHLQAAETLAETLDDHRRLSSVLALMAQYLVQQGEHRRALMAGQRAVTLAETFEDSTLQVETNFWLGAVYVVLGDYGPAIERFRRSLAAIPSDRLHERFALGGLPSVQCRGHIVQCLAEQGRFAEGSVYLDEAMRIAERVEHTITLLHAYFAVGFWSLRRGDLPRAIPILERGVALSQSRQQRAAFPRFAAVLGAAYALAGRSAEALTLLEQAVEQSTSGRYLHFYALGLTHLGEAYLLAGRMAEATQCAKRALEYAQTHRERGREAWALRFLGEMQTHQSTPDLASADAHYRQALALAEALGMRPLQAHCHRGLGTLYVKLGRREQACAELSAAIALYRAMDMTFWLPEAERALAEVEGH